MRKTSVRSFASKPSLGPALCLVLIGVTLGVATYRIASGYESRRALTEFDDRLTADAHALNVELLAIVEALNSLRAFFDASPAVTRAQFATFTRATPSRLPAIRAMEWVPRVRETDREAHEERVRSQGLVDYRIRDRLSSGEMVPSPRRAEYFPVEFAEPPEGNTCALGFDLGSDHIRHSALTRAMEMGQVAFTEPVVLVQDTGSAASFLGILPVYGNGASAIHAATDNPEGFAVAVCRIADILRESRLEPDSLASRMHFELIDIDPNGKQRVLHASAGLPAATASREWVSERRIRVGGREWRLIGYPTPEFLSQRLTWHPAAMGTIVSLLVGTFGALVYFLSRRSRDAALRAQDHTIRVVLGSLAEGVIVADGIGNILFANAAAERIVGKGARDVRRGRWSTEFGCYLADTTTPCPEERFPLARATRGEVVPEQVLVVRSEGERRGTWVRASATPLLDRDDTLLGGVTVLRDVTASMKSEQLVRRLSNAVEQTADGVFITDRNGRIIYVNPAFTESTGYSPDEALGNTPRILKSGKHDREYYRKLWATLLAGDVHRSTIVNRKKGGDLYYAEQTITPMRDAAGALTHFVSVTKDMTESRRIHEQEVEMHLAAEVQQNLYPEKVMQVPGFDIAGAVFPAEATCGDYFDIIRVREDMLGIAIGDVSGHGLGPALIMAQTRAYLRSIVQTGWHLGEIFERVNTALVDDLRSRFFVTLLFARIDLSNRRLVHASAGHTPCYVLHPSGDVKHVMAGTGTALGIAQGSPYGQGEEVTLEPGDLVVFVTDGVTETRTREGRFFEADGALAAVKAHRHESARKIVEHTYDAIRDFRGDSAQPDDITMVVCKVDAAPAS